MIQDKTQIRTRYGEVDQMGYVYHANYIDYCHQARTELLRRLHIHDNILEQNNIMLPVISFEINYKKPAYYDDLLTVVTTIKEMPKVRFHFGFEIFNQQSQLISEAKSTIVFVDSKSRTPIVAPDFIIRALNSNCKHTIT